MGPRALIALAGEIATFQAWSAEAGFLATAGATGAGTTIASLAAAIAAGAAAGTAIGYGLNKAFTAADLEGEVKERQEKAKKDINYAKAELDVYCKGTGALCKDDVKCSGKPGGYVYETAEGLGIGAGRELFGVPGFRTFKQAEYYHANDGAMMIGLGSTLALHDMDKNLIDLPREENNHINKGKAIFKDGAILPKYEKCLKKWLTKSNVMLSQAKKLGMTEPYEALRLVYGIDAFPSDPPDKKPGASPTPEPTPDGKKGPIKCDGYPITKNCIGKPVENLIVIAVGGTETGPTIVADTTNKFNRDTIDKLIDDQTLNQEVIDLITLILQKEEAFKVLKAWKQNKYTIKSGDVVDRWFDVTASRKGMTENLDFYRKLKKNKYNKLTNLLMERIK